ncbi:hypothetical protein [Desulfuribacillus alkaliarsenatis]|uniref:Uncharacterized protein n=1 Tax=Desulfuribacillus alkaliarsenatis TaxID=766136 RepID=A0A1E5G500_9FIRM|nr:hypothetical protein [Desulfuribacillus alkaliarsenatis]OEF98260.1 hypothetical protein BHF68_00820 [Desulfuribacillus alkaliarsenatis]
MEDNVRRIMMGVALASTAVLAFSREARRMVGKMAFKSATRAMDAVDETRDFLGNARDRIR